MKYLPILLTVILSACEIVTTRPPVTGEPPPRLPPCDQAAHAWTDADGFPYHLAHDNLSPVIVNDSNYPVDIDSWNELGTVVQLRDEGDGFPIYVQEGYCDGCLGLASITVDAYKHILSANVLLDRTKLDKYDPNAAAKTMCQELGHVITLGHQHGNMGSCMNECPTGSYAEWLSCMTNGATVPDAHDKQVIDEIYAHVNGGEPPQQKCVGTWTIVVHTVPDWGGL